MKFTAYTVFVAIVVTAYGWAVPLQSLSEGFRVSSRTFESLTSASSQDHSDGDGVDIYGKTSEKIPLNDLYLMSTEVYDFYDQDGHHSNTVIDPKEERVPNINEKNLRQLSRKKTNNTVRGTANNKPGPYNTTVYLKELITTDSTPEKVAHTSSKDNTSDDTFLGPDNSKTYSFNSLPDPKKKKMTSTTNDKHKIRPGKGTYINKDLAIDNNKPVPSRRPPQPLTVSATNSTGKEDTYGPGMTDNIDNMGLGAGRNFPVPSNTPISEEVSTTNPLVESAHTPNIKDTKNDTFQTRTIATLLMMIGFLPLFIGIVVKNIGKCRSKRNAPLDENILREFRKQMVY